MLKAGMKILFLTKPGKCAHGKKMRLVKERRPIFFHVHIL